MPILAVEYAVSFLNVVSILTVISSQIYVTTPALCKLDVGKSFEIFITSNF